MKKKSKNKEKLKLLAKARGLIKPAPLPKNQVIPDKKKESSKKKCRKTKN